MKVKYLVPLFTATYLSLAAVLKATSMGTRVKTSLLSFFDEKMPNALGAMLSATTASIAQFTSNAATLFFGSFLDICKISDSWCLTYQSLPVWLQHLYMWGMIVTLILIPVAIVYTLIVEFEVIRQHVLTPARRTELKRSLALTAFSFLLPFAWASAVISVIFCINQFGGGA